MIYTCTQVLRCQAEAASMFLNCISVQSQDNHLYSARRPSKMSSSLLNLSNSNNLAHSSSRTWQWRHLGDNFSPNSPPPIAGHSTVAPPVYELYFKNLMIHMLRNSWTNLKLLNWPQHDDLLTKFFKYQYSVKTKCCSHTWSLFCASNLYYVSTPLLIWGLTLLQWRNSWSYSTIYSPQVQI